MYVHVSPVSLESRCACLINLHQQFFRPLLQQLDQVTLNLPVLQLMAAEREKQQLQQERQLMQQRMGGQSQNSLAQHRAQELQRQVGAELTSSCCFFHDQQAHPACSHWGSRCTP